MAKQKSIIKLQGSIGELTFVKGKGGYYARERSGIDGKRIASDPAFARTRENNAEFGRAGRAGKTLRTALRLQLSHLPKDNVVARVTQSLMRVLKTDPVNVRGARSVAQGDIFLLQGFEFNRNAPLSATFFAPYDVLIDRTNGLLDVSVTAFTPKELLVAPQGATHYKLLSAAVALDFPNDQYEVAAQESGVLPWDQAEAAPLTLSHTLTPDNPYPMLLLLGVVFFQELNGQFYALRNGANNAMAVVGVSQGTT